MRFSHIALLVPLIAGCYEYQRVDVANSAPSGQPVMLTLTDAGTANLAAELGPSVEVVGGRLLSDSGDAYVLALSESRKQNGMEIDWRGEQVSISKAFVANVQSRRFSRTRTGLLTGGVIAALVVAQRILWGPGSVFGGGGPGGGTGPK